MDADRQEVDGLWSRIWKHVESRPAKVKRALAVPAQNVIDSGASGARFEPKKQYFAVVINEMFLAQARQWWTEYDPMALVVSEFTYDGKRTTVPFVVGPSLIQAKVEQIPGGMAITDTLVAGVHPYVGGKFALTIILAQVKRQSHAGKLLELVETVGRAFPEGAALEPYLKIAGAVLNGVDTLLGLEDTRPIAGQRWEYNDGISPWLEPGFFALIDADVKDLNESRLSVQKGRLLDGVGATAPPFRRSDFLLYSLRVVDARTDISELSFYPLFKKALQAAASNEEGSWDRAKATLVTVVQEMLMSPDLTFAQVQQLAVEFKSQLVDAKNTANNLVLGQVLAGKDSIADALGADRLRELRNLHSLLQM